MNESTESVCVRPPERRNCVPAQDSSCSNREAEVAAYLRWCATVQSARSNLQSPWRSGGSFLWCTNNRFRVTTPERRSLKSRRCRLRSPARRSSPSSCARGGSCVKIGPYPKFEPPRRSKQNAREKKTSTRFLWFKFWEKDVETSSGFTQMTGAAAEKSVWEGRTRAAHGWSTCQCFWNIFIYTVIITIKTNSFKKETNISKMRWIKIIQDIYIQHNKEDKKNQTGITALTAVFFWTPFSFLHSSVTLLPWLSWWSSLASLWLPPQTWWWLQCTFFSMGKMIVTIIAEDCSSH